MLSFRALLPTRDVVRNHLLHLVLLLAVLALLFDLLRQLRTGALPIRILSVFLWEGTVLGVVIGLAGIGLSMVYDILNFPNFAHGEYLTFGAFGGWVATYLLAGLGRFEPGGLLLLGLASDTVNSRALGISIVDTPVAVLLGALIAALTTVGLALASDRLVFHPMRDSSGISLLIASIGIAFFVRYGLATVFETGTIGLTSGANVPGYTVPVFGLTVGAHQVTLLVIAVGLMIGLHVFLQRTKLGTAMRAMSDDRDLAQITGVPVERVVRFTWIIGGGFTGIAGYLLVLERGTIVFDFGWLLLLLIFAGVILGGIGSIYGAMAGGLIIGLASRLSLVWLPPGFVNATAFAIMIVILFVRPRGLFSGGVTST